jgi:hypothetical protein
MKCQEKHVSSHFVQIGEEEKVRYCGCNKMKCILSCSILFTTNSNNISRTRGQKDTFSLGKKESTYAIEAN